MNTHSIILYLEPNTESLIKQTNDYKRQQKVANFHELRYTGDFCQLFQSYFSELGLQGSRLRCNGQGELSWTELK